MWIASLGVGGRLGVMSPGVLTTTESMDKGSMATRGETRTGRLGGPEGAGKRGAQCNKRWEVEGCQRMGLFAKAQRESLANGRRRSEPA
jgi:hypothetical protein